MGQRFEQTFQRRKIYTHDRVFNIISPQKNTKPQWNTTYIHTRMIKILIVLCWLECGPTELSYTTDVSVKWDIYFGNILEAFTKLNMHIPCDPGLPLLGIYLRGMKTDVHIKTSTQPFIFIATAILQKPETVKLHQWVYRKTNWYISVYQHTTQLEKETTMIPIMIWMNLKHIVLTSKSWSVLFWVLPFPSCSHHTNLEPHYFRPRLIQWPLCLPPAFQFCAPFQNNFHKTLFPYVIWKPNKNVKPPVSC